MIRRQQGFTSLLIFLGFFVAAILAVVIWKLKDCHYVQPECLTTPCNKTIICSSNSIFSFLKNKNEEKPLATATPSSTPTPDISNWKTYTDSKNKFSFKYPDNWHFVAGNYGNTEFYVDSGPEDETQMMHMGNEQLIVNIKTNQSFGEIKKQFAEVDPSPLTTLENKVAIKTSNQIYVLLSQNKVLELSTYIYPNQLDQISLTLKFTQ